MKFNQNFNLRIDAVANSLRRYAEESIGTKRIFNYDKVEAVDNLDHAFNSILESFHSVFECFSKSEVAYFYENPAVQFLKLVRNASHHSGDGLFESWNSKMFKTGNIESHSGATFLMFSHSPFGKQFYVSEYYVQLIDIEEMKHHEKILDKLCFDEMWSFAEKNKYPKDQLYLNLIPIVILAASFLFTFLKNKGFEPSFNDSEVYAGYFQEKIIDPDKWGYKEIKVPIDVFEG